MDFVFLFSISTISNQIIYFYNQLDVLQNAENSSSLSFQESMKSEESSLLAVKVAQGQWLLFNPKLMMGQRMAINSLYSIAQRLMLVKENVFFSLKMFL